MVNRRKCGERETGKRRGRCPSRTGHWAGIVAACMSCSQPVSAFSIMDAVVLSGPNGLRWQTVGKSNTPLLQTSHRYPSHTHTHTHTLTVIHSFSGRRGQAWELHDRCPWRLIHHSMPAVRRDRPGPRGCWID